MFWFFDFRLFLVLSQLNGFIRLWFAQQRKYLKFGFSLGLAHLCAYFGF